MSTDTDILADFLEAGVPSVTYAKGDDLTSKLADLFSVSKRQIRDWREQKAVKVHKYTGYGIVRIGKRAGVIIKVKNI